KSLRSTRKRTETRASAPLSTKMRWWTPPACLSSAASWPSPAKPACCRTKWVRELPGSRVAGFESYRTRELPSSRVAVSMGRVEQAFMPAVKVAKRGVEQAFQTCGSDIKTVTASAAEVILASRNQVRIGHDPRQKFPGFSHRAP